MAAIVLRVVPGVLVSMLLAGPVFAGTTSDMPDLAGGHALEHHRRPSASPRGTKATHKATQASRRRTPDTRHPVDHVTAFIDDSFSYTDTPSGQPSWSQTGIASWYGGSRWQGHHTSSGTTYNQDALTAAHATLPLGTRVRVALPNSDRAVTVTITDRPGTRTRIIDLSRGAARALGILDRGVAMVTLTPG